MPPVPNPIIAELPNETLCYAAIPSAASNPVKKKKGRKPKRGNQSEKLNEETKDKS